VRQADLIILATPVDTYERHLKEWGSSVQSGAIVSDVGASRDRLSSKRNESCLIGFALSARTPLPDGRRQRRRRLS
jgi:prephenate dehydrogenase